MSFTTHHYKNHLWGITSSHFSNKLIQAAKTIPGMSWAPPLRAWVGYKDAVEATANLLASQNLSVDTSQLQAPATVSTLAKTEGLWEFQKEAVEFLLSHAQDGCILADAVGCGKSGSALRAARALRQSTVVICPAFIQGVWGNAPEAEPAKWWPEASVFVCESLKPQSIPLNTTIVVCNYAIVSAWLETLIPFCKTLIIDEAHFLSNQKSQRSIALKKLAATASTRFALTGTPMANRPKDLFNLVDTISEGRFGASPFKFFLRHCGAKQVEIPVKDEMGTNRVVWDFRGSSNEEELSKRLSHFMLCRTKEDVKLQLPERRRQLVDLKVKHKTVFAGLLAGDKISDKAMRSALDRAADQKFPQVIDLVASYLGSSDKVVVFCYRRLAAEEIARGLASYGAVYIHGGLSQKERDRRIASKPQVLVATIDVTAGGISLVFASIAIYAELTYEPFEIIQTSGRLHRPGQMNPVLEVYPIALGTADELVRDAVIKKLDVYEKIIGKREGLKMDLKGHKEEAGREALKALAASLLKRGDDA